MWKLAVALLLVFLLIIPVSATPARDTAVMVNTLLDGKTPYTLELTDAQQIALGFDAYNLTNRATYKIIIKSATYNPKTETIDMYINAWRNGQSVRVNNPWHFYMPFSSGIPGSTSTTRLRNFGFMLISNIDMLPLGQPVNDDLFTVYGTHDGSLAWSAAYGTWQEAHDGVGGSLSAADNTSLPSAPHITAHASTAGSIIRMYRYQIVFNTSVIGSGGTPTSAVLRLKSISTTLTLGGKNQTALVEGNAWNMFDLIAGDYFNYSTTDYATRIDFTSLSAGSNVNFTLNAAGLSDISTTGNTEYYIMDGDEVDNSSSMVWVASGERRLRFYDINAATATNRPFMQGVYTPGGGGDTTPPSSLTAFANTTNCSQTNISFTKPTDADYAGFMVWWNDVADTNQTNATVYYNKSGLTASTTYTLSTKTFDLVGNVNATFTNYSVTTSACGVAPVANFTANVTNVCTVDYILFTDTSTNTPTSWNWSFGDGNLSTSQNPTKLYNITGLFTVNLTANNTYGADSEVKTNYINVSACAVVTPVPTTPVPTTAPPVGCTYTNLTGVTLINSTPWSITLGNLSWGTIQNVTEGNVSIWSCIGTPTTAPPTTAPPIPDLPAPDALDNWMEILFGNWWLWLLLFGALLIIMRD